MYANCLAIVVLNWNRREETRRCIESCPLGTKIYVLNNGCDEDQEYLPVQGRNEIVLSSRTNLGFAGGVNLVASLALAEGAEWLLLLNNDATLMPGAAESLLAVIDPGIAAVCPMIVDEGNGRVWSVGGKVSRRTGRVSSVFQGRWPDAIPLKSEEVDFGTGACLLMSAAAIQDIDGFDTTYFAYWEETDWCRRARKAGYRIVTCPEARVAHVGGVSSTPAVRLYLLVRNALLYMRRHHAPNDLVRFLPLFFLWTVPSWALKPFLADPKGTAGAVARALAWHLRRPPVADVRLPRRPLFPAIQPKGLASRPPGGRRLPRSGRRSRSR